MTITVTKPFTKRSALRELAIYFHSGRLSKADYVLRRAQLIDHLCGLTAELDPVLKMLLRSAGNGSAQGKSDVTAPQQDNTEPLNAKTQPNQVQGTSSQDRLLKALLIAIVVTALLIAGGWWFTRKPAVVATSTAATPAAVATTVAAPPVKSTSIIEQQLLDFTTQELSQTLVDALLNSWTAESTEQRAQVMMTPAFRTFRRGLQEQLQALQAYSPAELAGNAALGQIQQLATAMQLSELLTVIRELQPPTPAEAAALPADTAPASTIDGAATTPSGSSVP